MKKIQNTSKWNALECALLTMLAACLLVGAAALKKQDQLQQKMIRLHVVANSDSDRDQALKLQVRDKVLAFTEQTMRASDNRAAANAALHGGGDSPGERLLGQCRGTAGADGVSAEGI